jgi:hypothetical protein
VPGTLEGCARRLLRVVVVDRVDDVLAGVLRVGRGLLDRRLGFLGVGLQEAEKPCK